MKEMFRIAQLLKTGGVAEATEMIQRNLKHSNSTAYRSERPTEPANDGNIIEGTCRVVDEDLTDTFQDKQDHERPLSSNEPVKNKFTNLQDCIEQLTRFKMPDNASNTKKDKNFIEGIFTNHVGTRTYKLYIPKNIQTEPVPLIVMLHGCTQDPDDFALGTNMNMLADERQCFVLYPCQSQAASHMKCWNWFNENDQKRDQGEPCIIAGMTKKIINDYAIDPHRVYVAGLSAGGAMAAIMGITYPDIFAAVGVHSGLPYGIANDLPSALAAMQGKPSKSTLHKATGKRKTNRMPPMIVFHGDKDTKVHANNGDQLVQEHIESYTYREHPISTEEKPRMSIYQGKVPKGHDYRQSVYRDNQGRHILEHWSVKGAGHTWSGGNVAGSHTDSRGPDASREMIRFFYQHRLTNL